MSNEKSVIPLISVTTELQPGQSGTQMVPMLGGAVGSANSARAGYLMVIPVAGGGGGDPPQAFRLVNAGNIDLPQAAALLTSPPGDWTESDTPAADDTLASAERAADLEGGRHVCTSITATVSTLTAAASANVVLLVRDGPTGTGPIIWSTRLVIDYDAGLPIAGIALSGLNIPGSPDTEMTLEFDAAGGADVFESVSMTGHTVSAF